MTDRNEVTDAIATALEPFDLQYYVDGVMDSLDTVVDWDEQEEGDDDDEW
ncbi:hypothetical protein SEA_FINKLE_76 [Gordonia phage Finkle]|uniref:Uncharacterized protein n=1 Tax=Gordonia phage Finkle TaxID=2926099 RepID=A0A9E7SXJ4_9CAUD|nr:hypothetical protein QEH33_gp76 [Gordonia phage Finkle]UTN92990.1 hypothetical protein SEA_FINKLE_76 [Gordonia phage Finkle]